MTLRLAHTPPLAAACAAAALLLAAGCGGDSNGDSAAAPGERVAGARVFANAGCGSCHTHLRVPDQNLLHAGEALVERYDCLACHRLDDRGGTIRPGSVASVNAPDLSYVGASGSNVNWYDKHAAQAKEAAGGPWKESFTLITAKDREAIDVFLSSRVGAPKLAASVL